MRKRDARNAKRGTRAGFGGGRGIRHSIWRRWDGYHILETTPVPVLELWGDRGHPQPSRETIRIPDRPNIELVWFANASHSLLIERPAEVARTIVSFIREETTRDDKR